MIHMIFFGYSLSAQVYFGMLDALLAAEELPVEYKDRCQVSWQLPIFSFSIILCGILVSRS